MEVREIEKRGAFLTLKIEGEVREFFVVSETKEYCSYSSSLINAGNCIKCTMILREISHKKYDSYGLQVYYEPEKYEYFRGYAGLDYVEDLKQLEDKK